MIPPLALAVGLLAWSLVGNLLLGDHLYVTRNLLLAAVVVLLVHRWGVDAVTLGAAPGQLPPGLRWGGLTMVVVVAAVVAGALLSDHLPGIGPLLSDRRAELSSAALAHQVLWRIPLGTALFEEVVFRGALLGLLVLHASPIRAAAAASVVFGLWHVAPTIVALRLNDVAVGGGRGAAMIAGAVLATTVAGAALGALRLLSGSLLAPVLAHWAANAAGLLAASVSGGRG